MGRIILTNNNLWCNKLEYNFKKLLNLQETCKIDSSCFIRAYRKKRVKNENFYKNESGMIISNGTLIYKELMNELALEKLLFDFKILLENYNVAESIRIIRKNIFGSYLLIISINGFIIGFVDETSTYACYYHSGKNGYIVTNTFYNVNECSNSPYNILAILEDITCATIVGKETFFQNIYRLLEDEYFFIDNKKFEIKKVELNKYNYKYNNLEEAFKILKFEFENIAKARAKNIKHTLLFTTGGLDSRMELALHNYFGDCVTLGYWSGSDIITNGTEEDLNICKQLAQKTGTSFKFYDLSIPFEECLNSITEKEIKKFGEYAFIYAHNFKWLDIPNRILTKDIDSIGFGSLNEIIRETPQVDEIWNKQFSCEDLVKNVKMRSGIYGNIIKNEELINYISKKIKGIYNIENNIISKNKAVNIFNRNRLHSNTVVNNYINLYYYDFNICGEKRIVDLIESMPYEWRQDAKIIIYLTKNWNFNIMDIPYFSHHQKVLYDKEKNIIKKTNFSCLEKKIRKMLKNTIIYKPLISIGHRIRNKNNLLNLENKNILNKCNEILNNSKYIKNLNIELLEPKDNIGFDLPSLTKMTAEIYFIDLEKEENNINFKERL